MIVTDNSLDDTSNKVSYISLFHSLLVFNDLFCGFRIKSALLPCAMINKGVVIISIAIATKDMPDYSVMGTVTLDFNASRIENLWMSSNLRLAY